MHPLCFKKPLLSRRYLKKRGRFLPGIDTAAQEDTLAEADGKIARVWWVTFNQSYIRSLTMPWKFYRVKPADPDGESTATHITTLHRLSGENSHCIALYFSHISLIYIYSQYAVSIVFCSSPVSKQTQGPHCRILLENSSKALGLKTRKGLLLKGGMTSSPCVLGQSGWLQSLLLALK